MSEEAAAEPDLGAARLEPVDRARVPQHWPASRCLSILAAVVLHTAVFAAMLRSPNADPGAGGHQLDAIGVEIVTAEALSSFQKAGDSASAPAAAASEQPGENAPDTPAADDERQAKDDPLRSQPAPTPDDAASHDAPPVDTRDERPEPTPPIRDRPRDEDARDVSKPTAPSRSGGAMAEGRDAPSASVMPVRSAAQAGAVNRFVSDLRSSLARTKPRGLQMAGVAVVTFALLPSGELEYAHVSKSSGKALLDSAALNAVRRAAPFPRPPASMQRSELVFSIPYRFE